MQPIAIADSQISYYRSESQLVINIPSYPYFKQLWKNASKNYIKRDEEGTFEESFIGVFLLFLVVYLVPLTTLQKIILEPTLPKTWLAFVMSVFFISYLANFVYALNGSAQIELAPNSVQLYRKLHLFGYRIRVRTVDVKQVQFYSWRKIFREENELRVLCSLITKQRAYRVGRAVSRAEAEWITAEVASFLDTNKASNNAT